MNYWFTFSISASMGAFAGASAAAFAGAWNIAAGFALMGFALWAFADG